MELEKYLLQTDDEQTIFEFYSQGPRGNILKRVAYTPTTISNLWQLVMGDYNTETDEIDFLNVTNNNDREKVLATVGSTLYSFFDKLPQVMVYARGSTNSRTRLYQIGINSMYEQIIQDFEVYGELDGEFERFSKNKNYNSFIVIKK
jgi:hypothetical protein